MGRLSFSPLKSPIITCTASICAASSFEAEASTGKLDDPSTMGAVFDTGDPALSAIDFGWADASPLSVDEGGVDPIDLSGFGCPSIFLRLSVVKLHIWQLITASRCRASGFERILSLLHQ